MAAALLMRLALCHALTKRDSSRAEHASIINALISVRTNDTESSAIQNAARKA
jgi:hypothetical protein